MRKKKQAERVKRLSPLEALTTSTAQSFAHQNSVAIHSRRRVLEFEESEVDRAIAMLSAELSNQRRRKGVIGATLRGLTSVIERR